MSSVDEVAGQLVATNVPVLLLDTCIFLDTIRAIERRDAKRIEAAKLVLNECSTSPPRCIIVVSSIVQVEWDQNVQSVIDEARKHISWLQESADHFQDACRLLGHSNVFSPPDYESYDLPQVLFGLSEAILKAAICIDDNSQSKLRAFQRVVRKTPPSQKGKEIKDCTIIEDYFELSRLSRIAGFQKNLVFCTSNTSDYGKPGDQHPDFAAEFAATSLKFTTNLRWAYHELSR
jgi:hypothetical protein